MRSAYLLHHRVLDVHVLDLLWTHILSLCQLEKVLASVNDGQGAIGVDAPDVTAVQPAVRHGRRRLFRVLEVPLEHVRSAEAHLAARSLGVSHCVVHFGHALQLHLQARQWHADVAHGHVPRECDVAGRASFRLPIPGARFGE